jgi:hypothetical protein
MMNINPQGWVANRDQRPTAGIDVSKQHLDACWGAQELRTSRRKGVVGPPVVSHFATSVAWANVPSNEWATTDLARTSDIAQHTP